RLLRSLVVAERYTPPALLDEGRRADVIGVNHRAFAGKLRRERGLRPFDRLPLLDELQHFIPQRGEGDELAIHFLEELPDVRLERVQLAGRRWSRESRKQRRSPRAQTLGELSHAPRVPRTPRPPAPLRPRPARIRSGRSSTALGRRRAPPPTVRSPWRFHARSARRVRERASAAAKPPMRALPPLRARRRRPRPPSRPRSTARARGST